MSLDFVSSRPNKMQSQRGQWLNSDTVYPRKSAFEDYVGLNAGRLMKKKKKETSVIITLSDYVCVFFLSTFGAVDDSSRNLV